MNKPYYRSHASCCAVKANYNSSCEQTSNGRLTPKNNISYWVEKIFSLMD